MEEQDLFSRVMAPPTGEEDPYLPESEFEGAEERRDPSFSRTIGAAFANENTISSIGRAVERNRAGNTGPRISAEQVIAANPEYQQRLELLPEEYGELVLEARTEAELEFILRSGEERMRNAETLQTGGLGQNLASQLAVGLVDPVDWAVSIGTGGTGKLVTTGNTLRRVAVGGASAAAANVAVEGVISQDDPTRDGTDIFVAGALGLSIGSLLNIRGQSRQVRNADDAELPRAINRGVDEVTGRAASRVTTGFDMGRYMRRSRAAESSGDDRAAATTSSAYGRYQFLQDTWVSYYRRTFGDTGESREAILARRADGSIQDRVMQTFTLDNISRLERAGVEVTDGSVYLAHFLGPNDAIRVLRAPRDAAIEPLVRAASRKANASVFANIRTAGDLIRWANGKMNNEGAGPVQLGPPQLIDIDSLPPLDQRARDALTGANREDLGDRLFSVEAGSAGAAARQAEDVEYFGTELLLPGAYGRLLSSSVPADMRSLASQLLAGTSRKDDGVREITAEEVAASIERTWRSRVYMGYNPHFNDWAKEKGYGLIRRDLDSRPQQEFMREVTRAQLGDTSVSPQAQAAAKSFSEGYAEALRRAKQAGVDGFQDIPENAAYVPRKVNNRKFMELRREIGAEGIRAVLRNAMVQQGMPEEMAERVARAYEKGTFDRATGVKNDTFVGPSEDSVERLRYYLPDDDPELVDDVISYLKQFRKEANKDGGRISEARFRIDMDLLSKTEINGREYSALDIFEDDASLLFERYSRTVGGWIGLAERANIRSQNDWDIVTTQLREKHGNDPKRIKDLERLEEVKDLILGRSITSESGAGRRAAQAFMKLNFATSMGQAGMASIAEAGNIIAHMGLKNAMMHMPVFRSIWKQARNGDLDADFTDEVRALFGAGMRTKLSRGRAGYDEFAGEIELKTFDTIDRILDPMARGVSYAGGIGPINDYLQLLATKSYMQKLANVATGRAKFSEADIARLRDSGWHDGVLERALGEIRKHATFDGKRLVSLGYDKWDRDILQQTIESTDRMVYRAVQENDIGSSTWWMHSTLGRMLTQFRSFIFNAWVKQTLHGLRFRDKQAFAALMFTSTFGGLSYMARSYLNTATDPEARERRLNLKAIATATMASTGYASILPSVVDTGLVNAGEDALFAQVRTTGLSTDAITGAPIIQTANNLQSTLGSPIRTMRDDYEYSQQDFRKLTRLLPFNNVLGIRNAIDIMAEELPERSKEDDYWK